MRLQNGALVYFIEDELWHKGKAYAITEVKDGLLFSIEGYGSCEGAHRIHSSAIGRWVFLKQDTAITHARKTNTLSQLQQLLTA